LQKGPNGSGCLIPFGLGPKAPERIGGQAGQQIAVPGEGGEPRRQRLRVSGRDQVAGLTVGDDLTCRAGCRPDGG